MKSSVSWDFIVLQPCYPVALLKSQILLCNNKNWTLFLFIDMLIALDTLK